MDAHQALAAPGAHRPDWVIAVALAAALAIFAVVALAYVGAFKRKDGRAYGWWW